MRPFCVCPPRPRGHTAAGLGASEPRELPGSTPRRHLGSRARLAGQAD